ncbi:MAG TPA: CPBP family intramembrane metalloprotease domain-containing protein, partial [Terrisporobacter glycolicus]|nr:CPBP family intramembrane metalloprotease domain-containing protein [Terrisporobacter hibernicus]
MFSKKEDLVTLAKESKKLPNFIWATILAFLFMTGGQIIGGVCIIPLYIILSFSHSLSSNLKILELFIQLSSFVFISILVFVRVKYIEKRSISTLGFSKDSWLKKYIKGFVIGLVMMVIVVFMLCLFGCVSVEKNPSQPIGISAIGGVMLILVGWIIQGGTEEIVT